MLDESDVALQIPLIRAMKHLRGGQMIESILLANRHSIRNYHMVSKMEREDKITLHPFGYVGRGSWQGSIANDL